MPRQRSQRMQESEVKKELKKKKRQLALLVKQRPGGSESGKTEEILRLEQRISHLEDWLANTNR